MEKFVNHDKSIAHIALYAALIAALGLLPKFNIPSAGVPIT
ncbi:MAG TPA: biotin transporter BioY, partial [Gammaproteobacteria bacterium]|nr:biotin transporter BioY [Gammaproteobacteria bacterium]